MVHSERCPRQTPEERRHFTLRQEAGCAFRETLCCRAAQLSLENSQCAAHAVTADFLRAASFGEANERHQNMMQTKRQQQTFTGTKQHWTKFARAVDDVAEPVNAHGENRPNQGNDQADQSHHHRRDNWYKAGTAEERQCIRQANVVETFMQHPDDDPGNNSAEDPCVDRLDPQDILHVVGLQDRGIGGRQDTFRG